MLERLFVTQKGSSYKQQSVIVVTLHFLHGQVKITTSFPVSHRGISAESLDCGQAKPGIDQSRGG